LPLDSCNKIKKVTFYTFYLIKSQFYSSQYDMKVLRKIMIIKLISIFQSQIDLFFFTKNLNFFNLDLTILFKLNEIIRFFYLKIFNNLFNN